MGSNGNVDNVSPNGKWEFDSEVARCFANMLERSIPDYRSMRSLVYEIGEKFITPDTWITDIGCSTGLAIEPFTRNTRTKTSISSVTTPQQCWRSAGVNFR